MNQQMEQSLDSLFDQWQHGVCPGAQILIRQSGQTLYEKSFGYANLEHRIPITADTIFHVASISKQFTVLSVLLLWKDGLLDLDDDVRKYAGDLIFFQEPVSIRQMMNNVSGLRDQWELLFMRGIKINDSISMEDVNTTLKMQRRLNFPPQSAYLYSNMGFHLLSVIVERLSGMSFPEFAKTRIFDPLRMEHTCVRGNCSEIIPNLAYSYQDEGNGSYYYNPLNYSLYGPTSVNTCARDLSRMLDEYISPSRIDPEIIQVMKTPAVLTDGSQAEYCGGLMTHQFDGLTVYEHGGADAAYRGHVFCIPEKELEIIMLSNTTSRLMSRLAGQAARMILDLAPVPEPELPMAAALAPRAGLYLTSRPDDPQFVSVKEKDGTFYMEREYGDTPLLKTDDGGWQVGTLEEKLYFSESGLLYRLPGRFLCLSPAAPCTAGVLTAGNYLEEETGMRFSLSQDEDGRWQIYLPRYGSARLYDVPAAEKQNESEHTCCDSAFSFCPDFTMYIRPEGDALVLDGYRVKGLICRRL
ncbi:MAG TPA: beta-lactamase family protein [Candidatus Lachnoclostridium stercorigallinarum]|uniref:Beta-lactamase family protein n=1 Tax=Candidatus Lachnoclostridium stercorigallinarum TaxID=2838634 RepID=A0A9D2K4L1_9FIRM|nr:beta-lactamase family protein [Candidatus Lachnoclostridium stercorigallinarum]